MSVDQNRGYNDQPELQKMAAFLRERCERRQYGLTYYDQQKNMIKIPWPTVPRQNEDVSENFGMFTEWAYLSFRKRGNRGEQSENEALSAQKHRFRNALARADGLRQCKELSQETMRVYEFVDTKKDRDAGENGIRHNRNSPVIPYEQERMDLPPYPIHPSEYSDSSQPLDYQQWGSPMTVTSSPNHTPGYQNVGGFQVPPEPTEMQEDRAPSLGTLLEEMINTPEPTVPYTQSNGVYTTTFAEPQPVQSGVPAAQSMHTNYPVTGSELHVPNYTVSNHHANGVSPHSARPNHHLLIKVYFRGEEVMQRPMTNTTGFRLYSGNNIPDMRRLLDVNQRSQLQSMTKYPAVYLFGPENDFDQVEMPTPRGPAHNFGVRTMQVIENMDRGILFHLDHPPAQHIPYTDPVVPNVFAMRLCQTRVFPYDTNVSNRAQLEEHGLKRMEWVQIFDGFEFVHQMHKWTSRNGPQPSTTINLTAGQKPKRDKTETNLVSVTITVTAASLMVEKFFEDQMGDILISDKNSMDKAAQQHKDVVTSRIQMDDTAVY